MTSLSNTPSRHARAALACAIASFVCGMIESSAATTPAVAKPELAADAVSLQQLSEQLNRLEQKVDRLTALLLQRQPD